MRNLHQGVHHHLKLQHHKHTGKVLHHRHTSYRGLGVIFVLAGLVIVATTLMQRAAADSLMSVSGIVALPVPHASAMISTPADGSTVQSGDILVAGNCPIASPALTVVLTMDSIVAGSALCSTNSDYALTARLTPGSHKLITQTYTVTGGQGPDSPASIVTYQTKTTGSATKQAVSTAGPALVPDNPFDLVDADNTTEWSGRISDGTAPYRITVDWGDGKRDTYTTADAQLRYTHQYGTGTSHSITLAVADAKDQFAQIQYAAVNYLAVMNAPAALLNTTQAPASPGARTLAGLYGLYITVLAGSGIVWIEAKHAARHEALIGMPQP